VTGGLRVARQDRRVARDRLRVHSGEPADPPLGSDAVRRFRRHRVLGEVARPPRHCRRS